MSTVTDEERRNNTLLIDAVFLANKLTYEAKQIEHSGSDRFRKLVRVAGKAWKRYNRRAARVPGIIQLDLSYMDESNEK